jgi:hypothetical protein
MCIAGGGAGRKALIKGGETKRPHWERTSHGKA